MKLQPVIALFCLLQTAFAGGYQGCLERVHLFQAYEIEGLRPASDREFGYRCLDWDNSKGSSHCRGDRYEACVGSRNGGRCSYEELQDFMSGKKDKLTWKTLGNAVYQSNGKIDLEATALNCYSRYQEKSGGKVPNFPVYKAMKGTNGEYNDYLRKLGNRVDYVFRQHPDAGDRHLFDDFDSTRNEINRVRAGDHGVHLLPEARRSNVNNIAVKDLGTDPVSGNGMQSVDWARTANNARANGDTTVGARITAFCNTFYHGTTEDAKVARKHLQVFRSYKYMENRAKKCGRRT